MTNKAESMAGKFEKKSESVINDFTSGMSDKKLRDNHLAIHIATVAAAGVAISPIPFSDAALLVPIQMTMIGEIYDNFGYKRRDSISKSLIIELTTVAFARALPGNLLKFIPGLGTVPGVVINASVAVAITEAIGWSVVKRLDGQGEIDVAGLGEMVMNLFNLIKKAH